MIIDSSAVVAIVLQEPEGDLFSSIIGASAKRRMAAVNLFETLMVVEGRLGQIFAAVVSETLQKLRLELVPFDERQVLAAHAAWQRFGKGRHPAALNLADCCAYAAAVTLNEPLLFKGNDFALTDVPRVRW